MSSLPFTVLSALTALVVVLALIWLGARAARFSGLAPRAGAGRRLGLVETLALDPRRRLYLVRCDDRELLLLGGNGNDALIGWLTPPERQP
ncbi:MAG: flagellar biosynthetic protein FliO [Rhodospirillales bacterium]|nr:flagellar biosynthetic protein FliO [Rhodospirillales bacterium]